MTTKYPSFKFVYPEIMKYCNDLKTVKEQLAFLEWIKKEFRLKPNILYHGYDDSMEQHIQYDLQTKGIHQKEKPFLEKIEAHIDYYKSLDVENIESTEARKEDSYETEKSDESSESEMDFTHSDDYRSINLSNQQYNLTARQAVVIQILHEAFKNGTPELGLDTILEKIDSTNRRLRDTFTSRPDVWKNVIAKGESKGTFRLNIT